MENISSNESENSNVLKFNKPGEDKDNKLSVKMEQHELNMQHELFEQTTVLKDKLKCDDEERKKNKETYSTPFPIYSNIKVELNWELTEEVSEIINEISEQVSKELSMLDNPDNLSSSELNVLDNPDNISSIELSKLDNSDNTSATEKSNLEDSCQDELASNENKVSKRKSFISNNQKTYSKIDAEKSKRGRKRKIRDIEDNKVNSNDELKINKKKCFSLKLGDIFEITNNLKNAKRNVIKHLYKILYNNSPPIDGNKILNAILDFTCFSFKESSAEYYKRLQMLKSMAPTVIGEIANIFDIKCSQTRMASEIMKFLMKLQKYLIKYIEQEKSFQPIINLERLSLDDEAFFQALGLNKQSSIKSSLRTSLRKKELPDFIVKDTVIKKKSTSQINNSKTSCNKQEAKVLHGKIFLSTSKRKGKMPKMKEKPLIPKTLDDSFEKSNEDNTSQIKREILSESEDVNIENKKIASSDEIDKIHSKDILLNPKVVIETIDDLSLTNENSKDNELKSSKSKSTYSNQLFKENSSSEETVSAEESNIEVTKEIKKNPKKGKSIKPGMPLKKFPKIVASINTADFNDLQRLHILLFGASEDKLDLLKSNILAFGGFPFVEKSREWKEKEFLLSLLAQNTLKDYLNLLCIEYIDELQASLVNRLMKFLSCPTPKELEPSKFSDKAESPKSNLIEENTTKTNIKTSKPRHRKANIVKPSTSASTTKSVSQKSTNKGKDLKKKTKLKAKQKPATNKRHRKVLMDEAQVRRLEADIAREQRILAREKRIMEREAQKLLEKTAKRPFKNPANPNDKRQKKIDKTKLPLPTVTEQADIEKLDALLQTVYKRRALKEAGATISTPNKGKKIKLGELENVKFMVVTANYNDLDVLHHLIYMMDSNKSRVRKNILDFDGFGFNEDSEKYQKRMYFLNSLGYDISKRIAFLLGLSPYHTNIVQQDLNELIMYFLMSPTKIQHIPLRKFPESYLTESPKHLNTFKNQNHVSSISITSPFHCQTKLSKKIVSSSTKAVKEPTKKPSIKRPLPSILQKAKKSFNPNKLDPSLVKQVLLPPSTSILQTAQNNPIQSNATSYLSGIAPTAVQLPSASLPTQQIIIQSNANSQSPPTSFTMLPKLALSRQPAPSQLTPAYKVIRLPATSPTTSLVSNKSAPLQIQMPPPVISFPNSNQGTLLPTGIFVFKDKPLSVNQPIQNISCLKTIKPQTKLVPATFQQSLLAPKPKEEFVLPDKEVQSLDVWKNSEVEVLHPLEDSPPTDSELYQCIQDVIHSVNYEVNTLKNVIDKVSEKYSSFDLKPRHGFMKECVKKILLGSG